jgi:hypothetical protein
LSYRFQLIIQFDAVTLSDYDELVGLEDRFAEALGDSACVDGHDFGSGEFNVSVLTESPRATFQTISSLLQSHWSRRPVRAAYRGLDEEKYVSLWPPGATEFPMT